MSETGNLGAAASRVVRETGLAMEPSDLVRAVKGVQKAGNKKARALAEAEFPDPLPHWPDFHRRWAELGWESPARSNVIGALCRRVERIALNLHRASQLGDPEFAALNPYLRFDAKLERHADCRARHGTVYRRAQAPQLPCWRYDCGCGLYAESDRSLRRKGAAAPA